MFAEKNAVITADEMCDAHIIHFRFRQLMLTSLATHSNFQNLV